MATSKLVGSAAEAVAGLEPGMRLMVAGFGAVTSWPSSLLRAIAEHGAGDLTVIANTVGYTQYSPQALEGLVAKFMGSFGGSAYRETALQSQIMAGEIEFELVPQGTLAERIRAGGAGIEAFYTPTGVGTVVDTADKESREIGGRRCLLETALRADYAIAKARRVDELGNCQFAGTTKNFAPAMLSAARVGIVEAREIVPAGSIDPDQVDVPGIFVDTVVRSEIPMEEIEARARTAGRDVVGAAGDADRVGLPRDLMALRAALMIRDLGHLNLGIGLPQLIGRWLQDLDAPTRLHAENGVSGYRALASLEEWDPDLFDAGGLPIALIDGSATFDSAQAFAIARGGHLDAVVLGAFEVAENGDLANWTVPGAFIGGVGGALDLIASGAPIIVLMEHTTRDGRSRLRRACTLPLTARGCVGRIVTNLAVVEVTNEGFVLREVAPGVTAEQVVAATEAPLLVPPDLAEMDLSI